MTSSRIALPLGPFVLGCSCPADIVEIRVNPNNPYSAFATVEAAEDTTLVVGYGEDGSFDHQTPPVTLSAGETADVLVLGLRAGHDFNIRVETEDDSWAGRSQSWETPPDRLIPSDCQVTLNTHDDAFTEDEATCTGAWLTDGSHRLLCFDREGEVVWSLTYPEVIGLQTLRPMLDGGFAAVGEYRSLIARFDRTGALVGDWSALDFEGRTRFTHEMIDDHEVIQLTEGQWAGALAFLTNTEDEVAPGYWEYTSGIIVYDPDEDEVLWDWMGHGELGDGEPIDPKLDYFRLPQLDWTHGNALVHEVAADGREALWMSLRHQSWIIKIDVETDAIDWRFGYEGDFVLVDDIDSDHPVRLDRSAWFSYQHSPEFIEHDGDRVRFLLFDNGNERPLPYRADVPGRPYSRVVEYTIDPSTMLAERGFVYGSSEPGDPDHFYSEAVGDADMLADGRRVQFTKGWNGPFMGEVSYPEGELLWRLDCPSQFEFFRVAWFPDMYDTTWWYDVDR